MKDLPKSIQLLVSCIGYEATMQFISSITPCYDANHKRYLRQVYIPKQFNKLNKTIQNIISVVGEAHAKTIVFLYGGDCLRLPNCTSHKANIRKAAIQAELIKGKKPKELAREFGFTEAYINRIYDTPLIKVLPRGGGMRAETGPADSCVSAE